MTSQQWAEPSGYGPLPEDVPAIAYRILDRQSGQIVTRHTESTWDHQCQRWFLSLSVADQSYADAHTEILQRACAYFTDRDYTPLAGRPESHVGDDDVRARIARMNDGENAREARRMNQQKYPFDELPWAQQRALIEEIDHLKADWRFEIVGPVGSAATPPESSPPQPGPEAEWYEGY